MTKGGGDGNGWQCDVNKSVYNSVPSKSCLPCGFNGTNVSKHALYELVPVRVIVQLYDKHGLKIHFFYRQTGVVAWTYHTTQYTLHVVQWTLTLWKLYTKHTPFSCLPLTDRALIYFFFFILLFVWAIFFVALLDAITCAYCIV